MNMAAGGMVVIVDSPLQTMNLTPSSDDLN
jgi:hypothetical protein